MIRCSVCGFSLDEEAFAEYFEDREDNICNRCIEDTIGICDCGYRWMSKDGEEIDGPSILGPCPNCESIEGGGDYFYTVFDDPDYEFDEDEEN